MNNLEHKVTEAYNNYRKACLEFRVQANKVRFLKKELDLNIAGSYYHGEIEGKNQKERDAAEYGMYEKEHKEIAEEEFTESELFLKKEQAEIEVDYVRALLRIEELTQEI